MDRNERRRLAAYHAPGQVRQRMRQENGPGRLRDAILGGIDGAITTFAVVAASIGGGFSANVLLVFGAASLFADGLSMAVSNYMGARSEQERLAQARHRENRHIDLVPRHQADEVRQIFSEKGFNGDTLERIVEVITSERSQWVDTVVNEEFKLPLHAPSPVKAGLATMLAFVGVGALPLLPFLPFVFPPLNMNSAFGISLGMTGIAFLLIGMVKGRMLDTGTWRSGLQTLFTGAATALLAFLVGHGLRQWLGAAP